MEKSFEGFRSMLTEIVLMMAPAGFVEIGLFIG